MDFLKSAVASAISKTSSLPFALDDRVDLGQSIWTLHNGTRREDSSKCSVFTFDINANRSRLPLARNALRKLRTLRHPGVIKVLDTVENDNFIYISTERVTPLNWHIRRKSLAEETVKWGLFSIAKTLKFINGDASSVHGCVRASSVFTSESGEWKLGGFDVLSSVKEDDAVIYTYGSQTPDSNRYAPPEISKMGWDAVRKNPLPAIDAYGFGVLTFEAFNGELAGTEQLAQARNVPPSMQQSYKRLVSANPKSRISVAQFLEQGQRSGGFFETPLIHLTEGIENLGLKDQGEREEFLSQLDEVSDDFPEDFFKLKVLPELLKSIEFGGGGPKVLGIIMKISQKLSEEEYDQQITPVIIRLFQNQDRGLRVCLLDNLPLMIDHLSQKIVNNSIFPQMVTGFTDIAPVVREQTVKAVLVIVPKLSDRTVNGELLRHLAKTANDEQPGIRTNTTICLGKIARNLGNSTRTKVLTAAFARALRDPFVHARNAALLALAATADLYSEEDCATKLLPGICPSLVDKEKLVRDQANKTLDIYLQRVRKYSQTMPETVLPPPGAATATNAPRMGTAATDASSWAGWAISSFTNKLASASGDMSTTANGAPTTQQEQRSSSMPPPLSSTHTPASLAMSTKPLAGLKPPASPALKTPPFPTNAAEDDVADDFDTGWGDDGAWGEDMGAADADADAFDPFAQPSATTTSTAKAPFDDAGEPDFAGWLNAQSVAKKPASKPLPKGLAAAKSAGARPGLAGKSHSTGHAATVRSTTGAGAAAKAKPAPVKKVEVAKKVQPEEEEEEEGWGDAWE